MLRALSSQIFQNLQQRRIQKSSGALAAPINYPHSGKSFLVPSWKHLVQGHPVPLVLPHAPPGSVSWITPCTHGQAAMKSLQSSVFSRLKKSHSCSLSCQGKCFSPCPPYGPSPELAPVRRCRSCIEGPTVDAGSRCGLWRAEQRGTITPPVPGGAPVGRVSVLLALHDARAPR